MDAIEFLKTQDLSSFDAIHASPPCQAHSKCKQLSQARNGGAYGDHKDFIADTRELLDKIGKVYADPPYENTTGYSLGKFDSGEFWDYMRELSKEHIVLISEQTAPDDFEVVWEQELRRMLDINKENNFKITEKLFKWKG